MLKPEWAEDGWTVSFFDCWKSGGSWAIKVTYFAAPAEGAEEGRAGRYFHANAQWFEDTQYWKPQGIRYHIRWPNTVVVMWWRKPCSPTPVPPPFVSSARGSTSVARDLLQQAVAMADPSVQSPARGLALLRGFRGDKRRRQVLGPDSETSSEPDARLPNDGRSRSPPWSRNRRDYA